MRRSRRFWPRLVALCGSCAIVTALTTLGEGRGQVINAVTGQQPLVFDQVVGQPMGLPHLPPEGAWGEVINVTSRWIVIQNHTGQQFPIALEDIGEFLVRWPISLDILTNQSLVEAVGLNQGNNVVATEHVDVFEGGDRTLVSPTYNSPAPNNPFLTRIGSVFYGVGNPATYQGQNMLSGWAYPVNAGYFTMPARLHIVGNAIDLNPLRIGIPGNNIATIVPAQNFSATQVTRGNINHIRKGDYAFMMPLQIGQRGLILSQFVLYKSMPFRQFNPAAIR